LIIGVHFSWGQQSVRENKDKRQHRWGGERRCTHQYSSHPFSSKNHIFLSLPQQPRPHQGCHMTHNGELVCPLWLSSSGSQFSFPESTGTAQAHSPLCPGECFSPVPRHFSSQQGSHPQNPGAPCRSCNSLHPQGWGKGALRQASSPDCTREQESALAPPEGMGEGLCLGGQLWGTC
jgi:hypothetical protein